MSLTDTELASLRSDIAKYARKQNANTAAGEVAS